MWLTYHFVAKKEETIEEKVDSTPIAAEQTKPESAKAQSMTKTTSFPPARFSKNVKLNKDTSEPISMQQKRAGMAGSQYQSMESISDHVPPVTARKKSFSDKAKEVSRSLLSCNLLATMHKPKKLVTIQIEDFKN